jgi:CubicO group peptidase (beta-lactamase class C family)
MSRQDLLKQAVAVAIAGVLGMAATITFADTQGVPAANVDRVFASWNDSTPGCAIGLNKDGHQEIAKAYGMADLEHGIRNSPDTIFEAGSVSKQFTAAALLLLERDGKLSLDDSVRKYIPELPDYGVPLSIRDMLTHTSGLRDWGDIAAIEGWPRGTRVYDDADVLQIVSKQKNLNFAPGTRWAYSNTGYNLAEIIVSRVSGMSLAQFTRQRIFAPLGMTHSSWRDDYTRIVVGRAVAYSRAEDGFHAQMPFENTYGHGGLLTTVGDLLKWNEHLSSPIPADADIVSRQQRVYALRNGRPTGYGYGLFIGQYKGSLEVSHDGQTAGYTSFLARYPQQHLSVAILCNTSSARTWEYGHKMVDALLSDSRLHADPGGPATPAFRLSPAQLRNLTGTYRDVLTGRAATFTADSGTLHFGRGSVVVPLSAKKFLMGGRTGEIDPRGTIVLSDAYGASDTYGRVRAGSPSVEQVARFAGRYTSPEIDGEVTVVPEGTSISVRFGTKTTMTLAPSYENTFSNDTTTVVFSGRQAGKAATLTLSTDRVWNLRLLRTN